MAIVALILSGWLVVGSRAPAPAPPASTAAEAALRQWWEAYGAGFIEPDGRVVRPRDGRDTVSEGQAYALFFAAAVEDRAAFDRVRAWTRAHLSRRATHGDRLLAWHWVEGKVVDWNSAADADLDYALALLLGHRRWQDPALLDEAKAVAGDILARETARVERLGLLLLPGGWSDGATPGVLINPSYFSPAACRLLYEATGDARWKELAQSAYRVWEKCGERLGAARGAGLPPDWCRAMPGGSLEPAPERSGAFGWDALRVPMRAGLDAAFFEERAARAWLTRAPVRFFRAAFVRGAEEPASVYAYTGAVQDPAPSLAMTAMALFAFEAAGEPPPEKLTRAFDRQRAMPQARQDYYGQSLAFFPLAFRAGALKMEKPAWK